MNGIHDVGGMHGFGEVERDPAEHGFHFDWEPHVVAMVFSTGSTRNIDEFRHAIERMDPQDYLNTTYYEHWLDGLIRSLTEKEIVSAAELESKLDQAAPAPTSARADAEVQAERRGAAAGEPGGRASAHYRREIAAQPRYLPGEPVVARNTSPAGHTRLPRYVRGHRGVVAAHHGSFVFPDTNAHGRGESPQHLYAVRFESAELWGSEGVAKEAVYIDLWESYLLPG